jgi:hypothetical protein
VSRRGAEAYRYGKGWSGAARVRGRSRRVLGGLVRRGSRIPFPGQERVFVFMGFKGIFEILLILVRVYLVF